MSILGKDHFKSACCVREHIDILTSETEHRKSFQVKFIDMATSVHNFAGEAMAA